MAQKVDELYWELRARQGQLEGDLLRAERYAKVTGDRLAKSFQFGFKGIPKTTEEIKKKISDINLVLDKLKPQTAKWIELNKEVKTLSKSIQYVETVGERSVSSLNKFAQIGMIMTGVNQTFELVSSTIQRFKTDILAGAELEVLRSNFQGATKDLNDFKKATAGTVSEANLIKLSNQATDLGLSLEEQTIFFGLAEKSGDKYGGSLEENFQKIVFASEGNIKGLKALGIEKGKYEATVNKLALAHGNEITKLDAETQKMVRIQAIIQSSGMTYQEAINTNIDLKDTYEQLSVKVDEAKQDFGIFVAQGLKPVIDAMLGSSGGAKTFVGGLTLIFSNIGTVLPVLISFKMLQQQIEMQNYKTATSNVVVGDSFVAAGGKLKMFLSALGAGAAVVGVIKLVGDALDNIVYPNGKNFWERQREQIDKTKQSLTGLEKTQNAIQSQLAKKPGGLEKLNQDSEVDKVKKKITELNNEIEKGGLSFKRNTEIQTELNRLNKLLTPEIKAQETLSKQLGIALSEETTKRKALLEAALKTTKSEVDRFNIQKELDALEKDIFDTKIKILEKSILESKDLEKKIILEKELIALRMKNAGIDEGLGAEASPRGSERVKPTDKYKNSFGASQDASGKKLKSGVKEDFMQMEGYAKEFSDAIGQSYTSALDLIKIESSNAKSVLDTIWVNMANAFITQVQRMVAEWIAFKVMTFLGGLLLAPATGGASMAMAATSGGTFEGGKKVSGFGGFTVPSGYPNDRYPLMVSSGERVQVTPTGAVGQQEKLLSEVVNSIRAMNMNLINKNMSVTVQNNAPGVRTQVVENKKTENKLELRGKVLNEY